MTKKQESFEKIIADWDTVLFRSAKSVQEDYIIVRHKELAWEERFPNRTEFWGHFKKREGGFLKKLNNLMGVCDLSDFSPDDFEIIDQSELRKGVKDHLEEAKRQFDFAVGKLKKLVNAKDYELVIGGEDNFRYEAAQQIPYKANRGEKPLLFKELRELVLSQYKGKITVCNGREADDYCSEKGFENYQHYLKTKKWKYCLAYVDKDLKMIVSPHINYDKEIESMKVVYNTPKEAAYCYCLQLLIGDKQVDNIPGVEKLTEEVRERWELGNVRGVGERTCKKILDTCDSVKELFEAVVFCYKSCYGEKKKTFTTHRGEEVKWNWKNYLQDSAYLLWMHRNEALDYDIFRDTLDKLKVEY